MTRRSYLSTLSALLTLPWLGIVIGWQSWPAWLLVVPVYLAVRWLLDRLTAHQDLGRLEARLAALEEEAARGPRRRRSDSEEVP